MFIKILRNFESKRFVKGFEKIFKARDLRNVLYIFKASIKIFYKPLKQAS